MRNSETIDFQNIILAQYVLWTPALNYTKTSCYIFPLQNFNNKTNNILYFMKEVIPSTPTRKSAQQPNHLQSLLRKQFNQLFSRHPFLSPGQAFSLEAAHMHIQVLRKMQQVQLLKQEVEFLRKQLEMKSPQNKRPSDPHVLPHSDSANHQNRRRARRMAEDIARHYECKYQKCNKSYGSEGSLNQHIKLKHRQLYKQQLMAPTASKESPNSPN